MYGLLIYRQRDRAGFFFSYCFYRNKVVLLAQAHKPAHSDINELKVLLVVYVDVHHPTDEAVHGVEDAPLAEFALGGRGCWVNASRVRFMGFPLPLGGEGALLTALEHYSAVRSHQAVRTAGSPLPKRAEGRTHRPCADCIDRSQATQGKGYASKLLEAAFWEVQRKCGGMGGASAPRFLRSTRSLSHPTSTRSAAVTKRMSSGRRSSICL